MAKRKAETAADDDGDYVAPAPATAERAVFVDTNLDTHLAMLVSDSDTVCLLKQKILDEHPKCFPDHGEIKIHALKVKRKGYHYHLSDSMLVKSAFDGVAKSWFLFVDVSSQVQLCETPACKYDVNSDGPSKMLVDSLMLLAGNRGGEQKICGENQSVNSEHLEMEINGNPEYCLRSSSSDTDKRPDPKIQKESDLSCEKDGVAGVRRERKEDSPKIGVSDMVQITPQEDQVRTMPIRNTHERKSRTEVVPDNDLPENDGTTHSSQTRMEAEAVGDDMLKSSFGDGEKRSESETKKGFSINLEDKVQSSFGNLKNGMEDMHLGEPSGESPKIRHVKKKQKKKKEIEATADIALKDKDDSINVSTKATSYPANEVTETIIGNVDSGPDKRHHLDDAIEEQENVVDHDNANSKTHVDDGVLPKTLTAENIEFANHDAQELPVNKNGLERDASEPETIATEGDKEHVLKGGLRPRSKAKETGKKKQKKKLSDSGNQASVMEPILEKSQQEDPKETLKGMRLDSLVNSDAVADTTSAQEPTTFQSSVTNNQTSCNDIVKEGCDGNEVPLESKGQVGSGSIQKEINIVEAAPGPRLTRTRRTKKLRDDKSKRPLVEKPDNVKDVALTVNDNILNGSAPHLENNTDVNQTLSQHDNSKVMTSNHEPSSLDGTEVVSKAEIAPPQLLGTDGTKKSGKYSKKKKTKGAKNSITEKEGLLVLENDNDFQDGQAEAQKKHTSNEADERERVLHQTSEKEDSKLETANVSKDDGGEADGMDQNDAGPLLLSQIRNLEKNTETRSDKVKKKMKRKPSVPVKDTSESPVKEQDRISHQNVHREEDNTTHELPHQFQRDRPEEDAETDSDKFHKRTEKKQRVSENNLSVVPVYDKDVKGDLMALDEKTSGVDTLKKASKIKSSKSASLSQSIHLIPNADADEECESIRKGSESLQNAGIADIRERSSNTKVDGAYPEKSDINVAKQPTEMSVERSHHLTKEDASSEVPADSPDARKLDIQQEGKQNAKQLNPSSSLDTSSNVHHSPKPSKDEGNQRSSKGRVQPKKSAVELKQEGSVPQPGGRSFKVPKEGKQASVQNRSTRTVRHGTVRVNMKDGSESSGLSKGGSDTSPRRAHLAKKAKGQENKQDQYHMSFRKTLKNAEAVNISPQKKGVLVKSRAIFDDESSGSSEQEGGVQHSDSSTRSPSDNLSSSDYSEGESNPNLESPQTGGRNIARKSNTNLNLSSKKNLTMESILRSSKRYRRAKLVASQSQQEDSESQPVNCVPDSQANM